MAPTRLLVNDIARLLELAAPIDAEAASWRPLAADPIHASRLGTPSHFTASALPVTPDGRRVCLVLHGKIGLWLQPGGHLEENDAGVREAAAREMGEEVGLAGVVGPRPVLFSRHPAPCGTGRWHLDLQFAARVEERPPSVSDESRAVQWFPRHRLPLDIAPGVGDLVEAAVDQVRSVDSARSVDAVRRNGSRSSTSPAG